jgi:DNA primase
MTMPVKNARDYLHNRGINDEIIFNFCLGFAPEGWENLLEFLTKEHKFSTDTIDQAGLIKKREVLMGIMTDSETG